MILSVIIPVRATTNIDVLERISWKRLDKQIPDSVEFVIVDDGSDLDNAKKIEEKCKELGYEYFYIPSSDKYFSLARARNKGVFEAKGQFVLIEDVDFAPYTGYYQDLIDEIYINNLDKETENFITLPSIWLTEPASKEFLADNSRFTSKKLIQKYFEYDLDYFEMGIPTGSCLLMSRHHYLSIGGQNESFDRWGFEDHEFANRLISFASKFPKPKNSDVYKNVVYTNYVDYEGFRAVYRLYGDVCANKGIYNFHIYHPINSEFRNQKIRQNNQELFEKCRKELSTNLYYLPYIYNKHNGKTCITSTNPFVLNREIFPLYGEIIFLDESKLEPEDFYQALLDNQVNRVVMQNPYKTEKKLQLYRYLLEKNVKCIVAERGSLPNSVYFDDTGFCCESTRYQEKHWDKELSQEQRNQILNYLKDFKVNLNSLEKQNPYVSELKFREKYNIYSSKKILFIPFQMRTDATVKYFAGKIESYDNFVNLVAEVTAKLPRNWVVVYKNHPLEPEKVVIPNAINVDDENIYTLIEASSMILLMNSGCGVLSALFNKPVLHAAQAQYRSDYFNREVSTTDEVLQYCKEPFEVDSEKVLRFFYYLVYEFYSFAENVYMKRPGKPDSWPVRLIFNIIRFEGKEVLYRRDLSKSVWRGSILFDRYRTYFTNQEKSKKDSKKAEPKKQVQNTPKSKENPPKVVSENNNANSVVSGHKLENKLLKKILTEKKYKKYLKNRDLFFKDSKSLITKFYYLLNK